MNTTPHRAVARVVFLEGDCTMAIEHARSPARGISTWAATSKRFSDYYTHYLPSRIAKLRDFIINPSETDASVRSRQWEGQEAMEGVDF